MEAMVMVMKIAILGYSGSGKSTLTKFLSEHYSIPLLYLDTVEFTENWQERDLDQAKKIVADFMQSNSSWVIDGNYTGFYQKERLEAADKIILMKFNRISCLYRAYKRYFKYKNTTRESISNGCIEKIDFEFVKWILLAGRTKDKRKKFNDISSLPKTITIKNQRELNNFMKGL